MNSNNIKNLVLNSLFIALVYVATRFINIPGPTPGGLFHLGNVIFFTIAIVFGKKAGAISGGVGMALFDLTSPYAIWAPFTLVIRMAMGYIIGAAAEKFQKKKAYNIVSILVGITVATLVMIVGYYISEVILYHNFITPLQSVWGNFMQSVVGTVIGVPFSVTLKAALKKANVNIYLEDKRISIK
ncbi:ECF transporter S component [Clostridium gasigenes]|uniref:ECF transporter S component n=1 Tax=Clostridium gasigenes TaxID=94869 RepID=UPI001C0BD268|nr:ECF transporter S component [Clostridium gasigenes]MBU3131845.1 ECF transporter S component [Clostridium gasigenes]